MEILQTKVFFLLETFQGRPYVQAVIVFALSIVFAYALSAVVKRLCGKIVRFTRFTLDNEIALIIRAPVVYSVLMVGFIIALSILNLPETLHAVTVSILKSANILIWMVFAIRLSRLLLRASAENQTRIKIIHPQSLPLFENLAVLLVIGFSIYLAFQTWGINMTAWLASAGVLGIAIGFASKDTLSNFIAGIFILADAPYKIGDYVVLDTGERGAITDIGIRSTRMLTRDDVELTIPNAIMGNTKIINESGGPYQKFRIRIPVGVAYGSDIAQAKAILLDVAKDNPLVCPYPEARVRLRQLGASGLDLELLCWVEHPAQRGLATDELLTVIYNTFNQAGIEIPFPKQDVYIKEAPERDRAATQPGREE
ncbi:mechanosensitive ion channel family protein [Candidatus Spongiihabitans sp.]|uniref:mechanosensitive ion channel family protein n=1 Tax=Candidatus Spongiihabitans sp. TaxID=3101308 RepID=UPI003C798DDA